MIAWWIQKIKYVSIYTLIIIQVLRSQVMLIFQMVSVFRLRLGTKFTLSTSEDKQKVRTVVRGVTLHYLNSLPKFIVIIDMFIEFISACASVWTQMTMKQSRAIWLNGFIWGSINHRISMLRQTFITDFSQSFKGVSWCSNLGTFFIIWPCWAFGKKTFQVSINSTGKEIVKKSVSYFLQHGLESYFVPLETFDHPRFQCPIPWSLQD